jgi:8-oxo-dGTP pyrophosphatase MutT (NUDIX family)
MPHDALVPPTGGRKVLTFGVIAYSKGEGGTLSYLLLKNTKSETWDFPKVRPDKKDGSPLNTAMRALVEEAGVSASQVRLATELGSMTNQYAFSFDNDEGETVHVRKDAVYYFAEIAETEVMLREGELEWVPFKEAIPRMGHEESKKLLRAAHQKLQGAKSARMPAKRTQPDLPEATVALTEVAEEQVSCGVVPYTLVRTTEGGVVIRYLILQHQAGHWIFPNGKIRGEGEAAISTTAKCEFTEQCGIGLDSFRLLPGVAPLEHAYTFTREKWSKGRGSGRQRIVKNISKRLVLFLGEVANGSEQTVVLQKSSAGVQRTELKDFKWAEFEEAVTTLTLEETKNLMRQAHERLAETMAQNFNT